MLSEESYLSAILVYSGSAIIVLLLLTWWLRRRLSPGWVAFLVLLAAALLLTPAYPKDGVATLAPALVVAVFQFLTEGLEAAEHALKPLLFMSGLAIVLALLLQFLVFRGRTGKSAATTPEQG